MKQICWIALLVIGALCLGPVRPAAADAAPPWYAQGASVETSESMTQVQMVSEEVLLVVQERPSQNPDYLAAEAMIGHVEATFVMQNQGAVEEAFDVWFPLGAPGLDTWSSEAINVDGDPGLVSNFAAWVDSEPALVSQQELIDQWDQPIRWASWPAVFPPGQEVVLRVSYDVLPVGYEPYGTFYYVLQTGAGWWGPIQEGTVTFRLPYEVNASNTVLDSDHARCSPDVFSLAGEQMVWELNSSSWVCSPNPSDWTLSGTDVIWQFTDLEPTRDDNVYLTVLASDRWRQIQAAQQETSDMDSPQAHLHLARTLADTIVYRNLGPEPFSPNTDFAAQADLAYRRVLELDPQSGKVYVEYLEFMVNMWSAFEPLPDNWLSVLERAWELNPDDERLLRSVQQAITELQWAVQVCPTAAPEPTPTPTSVPSAIYTPLPVPTDRTTDTPPTPAGLNSPLSSPPESATATSVPSPSPSPAPVSASSPTPTTVSLDETTPTPAPTPITQPTLTPTSAPVSENGGEIPGSAVALGLLSLTVLGGGGIYYIKRQRSG